MSNSLLPLRISQQPQSATDDALKHVLQVLSARRWWLLTTFLLVMTLAVVAVRRQVPIYRATGTMTVEISAPRVFGSETDIAPLGATTASATRAFYTAQRQILQSRDLAAIVANRLGLARDPKFLGFDRAEKPLTQSQRDAIMASADVVGMLAGRIIVDAADDSGVVKLSVEDADPEYARDIVNAVLKAYRDRNIDVKKRVVKEASSDLNAIFKRLEGEKNQSQNELFKFEKENDFSETRRTNLADRILALSRAEREVRTVKLRAQQEMTQLKKFRGSKDVFSVSAPALLRDGLVGELKRRYLDVSTKRKELAVTYLDSHPRIQALDQQSEQLLTLAARHVTAVYDAAAQQYRAAEAEERDIHQQLQAAQDEDRQVRQAKIEHDSLRARSEEDKMFYEKVAKRITETDLLRDIGVNNINILDLAVTPKAPVRPNVRLSLILGGLLALLVGVAVAFGVDALDNTVKNREDVEGLLHVPWLGSIPTFQAINPKEGLPVPEDRIDLYVHYRPNSLAAEAARAVRTNLLFMRPDNPARSILITSGSPREGKSSTSATLAITLAASTGRTILVDTDLRKPRLHKLFGVPGGQGGLTSYLLSHSPVDEFICKTDVPGLDFMPCGPLPPNPAELMHSDRFLTLKEELTAKYEVVLFDSSPVGLVTDPLVLASMCDGVVVVAHADQTRRESLRNTLGALKSVGAEVLGVVLSRSTHLTGGYNYYYGGKAYGGDGDDQRYGYRYRYRYRYRRDPDQGDDNGEGDTPAGKS